MEEALNPDDDQKHFFTAVDMDGEKLLKWNTL